MERIYKYMLGRVRVFLCEWSCKAWKRQDKYEIFLPEYRAAHFLHYRAHFHPYEFRRAIATLRDHKENGVP